MGLAENKRPPRASRRAKPTSGIRFQPQALPQRLPDKAQRGGNRQRSGNAAVMAAAETASSHSRRRKDTKPRGSATPTPPPAHVRRQRNSARSKREQREARKNKRACSHMLPRFTIFYDFVVTGINLHQEHYNTDCLLCQGTKKAVVNCFSCAQSLPTALAILFKHL